MTQKQALNILRTILRNLVLSTLCTGTVLSIVSIVGFHRGGFDPPQSQILDYALLFRNANGVWPKSYRELLEMQPQTPVKLESFRRERQIEFIPLSPSHCKVKYTDITYLYCLERERIFLLRYDKAVAERIRLDEKSWYRYYRENREDRELAQKYGVRTAE